jgi:hypothetical protein
MTDQPRLFLGRRTLEVSAGAQIHYGSSIGSYRVRVVLALAASRFNASTQAATKYFTRNKRFGFKLLQAEKRGFAEGLSRAMLLDVTRANVVGIRREVHIEHVRIFADGSVSRIASGLARADAVSKTQTSGVMGVGFFPKTLGKNSGHSQKRPSRAA